MISNRQISFNQIQWRKPAFKIILAVCLLAAAWFLLGVDFSAFLLWWLALLLIGATFMPLTSRLFPHFKDRGWMFSKVIGVAACGFLTWLLVVGGILPFTTLSCLAVTVVCMAANLVLALNVRRKNKEILPEDGNDLIFWEEVIFFVAFLLWTYFAGFNPAAYGTEKFMDFGFMQSMMKSTTLPAVDMWYSQKTINYYYGGQYFAVFLTKLTTTSVEITYNLMRTMVAGFAFVLPFSLVRQMLDDRMKDEEKRHKSVILTLGGLLAGGAVSLAGNMHYVVYRIVIPLFQTLRGAADQVSSYWFPDATRYIGHNPDTLDHTIHEFPSYSFILGDLHAHMVNIFFVLTVIALLYAWLFNNRGKSWRQLTVLVLGAFLGIFQFTNSWDFIIYYVVICGTLFFGNLKRYHRRMRIGVGCSVIQWLEVLAAGLIVSLPFNLTFDSGMVQGIALAQNHSAFYQLCVLWALPVLVCGAFLVRFIYRMLKIRFGKFMQKVSPADLFCAIMSLCAIGLIIIPELVYVRDIYEETAARSNTMFKLTYQAFILFGISMAYILVRFISAGSRKVERVYGIVMTCLLLSTFGYFGNAVYAWFGDVWNPGDYQTLDATLFLEDYYPEDAGAIRWLNKNIEGRPVVLEANGDSYSEYDRVSAMTGLPTVFGWYVHEWLWRNDPADLNQIAKDIETIYTSDDEDTVRALLDQYDVSYIFIGSCEREAYENLNEELLCSLGDVVYEDGATIIQVNPS